MIDHKDHIRLLHKRGVISVSLLVSGTPAIQSEGSDREVTPTIITPTINSNNSPSIVEVGWSVDGNPISVVWQDGYAIDPVTGALTLTKNIEPNKYHVLVFTCKCVLNGQSYIVSSEGLPIGSSAKNDGLYEASCSHTQMGYTEANDKLLLHEYLQANNIEQNENLEQYADGKSYLLKATVLLSKGEFPYSTLPESIMMRILMNGEEQYPDTFSASWLLKAQYPYIWIDLRLVDTLELYVQFVENEIEIARTYLTAKRNYSNKTTISPTVGYDLSNKTKGYYDTVAIYNDYGKVEYPELHYDITWESEVGNEIGYGNKINTNSTHLGLLKNQIKEVLVKSQERGAYCPAVDEEENYLIDENGYTLII